MSQFVWPRYREYNTAGTPLVGGKLNFYIAGTSTREDTYVEQALTTPNANPVVASGAGVFGPIYLSDSVEYKVVLTDSDDNVIWTEDNWDGTQAVSLGSSTRLQQIASTPLDYRSAVGDGVADEYLAVQDAIDNAVRVVDLLGHTFRCDSAITLKAEITLQNGTLDFTNCTDAEYIKAQGSVGSYTNFTSNVNYQDDDVRVTSATGLASGDTVNIVSNGSYAGTGVQGEIAEIRNISTLRVYTAGEVLDRYLTASTARLAKVTTVDNIVIKNLTVTANNAVATANTRIFSFHATKGLRMRDVNISGVADYAVLLAGCRDTVLDGVRITNGAATTSTGLLLEEATQDLTVRDCDFRRLGTGIDSSTTLALSTVPIGVRRRIAISNCTFELSESGYGSAIHIGVDTQYVYISDSYVTGGDTGAQITVECIDIEIDHNRIDSAGGDGISLSVNAPNRTGRGYRVSVTSNVIRGADADIAYTSSAPGAGSSGVVDELNIEDNKLDQGQISIAAASTGPDVEYITLADNKARNTSIVGTNVTMGDILISNNRFGGATVVPVAVTEIDRITISGNVIRGDGSTTTTGLQYVGVAGSTELNIHNNTITNFITTGILTTDAAGTTVVNITGNTIKDTGAATSAAMSITNIPSGAISGNVVSSYGDGIILTATANLFDGVAICSNTIKAGTGAGAGHGLYVVATIAGNLGLTITGNNIDLDNSGASDYVLYIAGRLAGCTISGNSLNRGNDTDDNLRLAGTGAGDITRVIIAGNDLYNGDYGINGTNGTEIAAQNNNYRGMASGSITGTVAYNLYGQPEPGSDENGVVGIGDGSGHGGTFTGGATGSPINLVASAEPTGAAGDIYTNSTTNLPVAHNGSVWAPIGGLLYVGTDATDTRTTDGIFAQSYTIPANSLRAGSVIRVRAQGAVSALSAGTGDPYLEIHLDGNIIVTSNATVNLSAAESFTLDAYVVVRTIGSPGSLSCGGYGSITDGSGAPQGFDQSKIYAIDTAATIAVEIDLNGMAASGDTMRLELLVVEAYG